MRKMANQLNVKPCTIKTTVIIDLGLTGADYGLGTIGTCLGPPPAGGPPFDQKKNPLDNRFLSGVRAANSESVTKFHSSTWRKGR